MRARERDPCDEAVTKGSCGARSGWLVGLPGPGSGARSAALLRVAGLDVGSLPGESALDAIVCACAEAQVLARRQLLDLKRGFPETPLVAVGAGEGPLAR